MDNRQSRKVFLNKSQNGVSLDSNEDCARPKQTRAIWQQGTNPSQ